MLLLNPHCSQGDCFLVSVFNKQVQKSCFVLFLHLVGWIDPYVFLKIEFGWCFFARNHFLPHLSDLHCMTNFHTPATGLCDLFYEQRSRCVSFHCKIPWRESEKHTEMCATQWTECPAVWSLFGVVKSYWSLWNTPKSADFKTYFTMFIICTYKMTHNSWLRMSKSRNVLHVMIFHPVFFYFTIKKTNLCCAKMLLGLKSLNTVCLSSYPAGRYLWFRIFEENQTVPDQHHPGRAPIFPATKQTHTHWSDGILNRKSYSPSFIQTVCSYKHTHVNVTCNGSSLMTPHLSFRPPSAIFVLFKRPAFSNSWERIKRV